MDVQELATLLARYRARRWRLRRVDTSGMTSVERHRHAHKLGGVEATIRLAEQLLERRRAQAQASVETRPFFQVDDTECYLPDVDEALLAAFEQGKER
jgi:hypothetical protein